MTLPAPAKACCGENWCPGRNHTARL